LITFFSTRRYFSYI